MACVQPAVRDSVRSVPSADAGSPCLSCDSVRQLGDEQSGIRSEQTQSTTTSTLQGTGTADVRSVPSADAESPCLPSDSVRQLGDDTGTDETDEAGLAQLPSSQRYRVLAEW